MNDMNPADLQALAATDYRAALAITTFSLAESVASLDDSVSSLAFAVRVVTVGSVVAGLAAVVMIVWIWRDAIRMSRDDKRRHAETMASLRKDMKASERRHAETMASLRKDMKASERRHAETMASLRKDRKALDALIRRSRPSTRHIGRRYP